MPSIRPFTETEGRQSAPHPPVGPGRVLLVVYAFFTLAAGARSTVQLATRASEAPLAYGLSAFAAVVYLVGAVLIGLSDKDPRRAAWAQTLCWVELLGVALVGTLSLLAPELFPDATVWSHYGSGYGFVPALLPLVTLGWLHGHRFGLRG